MGVLRSRVTQMCADISRETEIHLSLENAYILTTEHNIILGN